MNEITIRFYTDKNNIDPNFLENLDEFAEQYGLQVEKEPFRVVDAVKRERRLSHNEFVRLSKEISEEIGPVTSNSADHIREMRDSR